MNTQLVVVGGGPGGYAAAFLAADLGMNVTLVDRESRLGGVCLLRGCIPSKGLLHLAKTMAEAGQLADWGISFPEPDIDIDAVRARKEKLIDTLAGGLGQLASRRKVNVICAHAMFEDSNTLKLEAVGEEPSVDHRVRFDHCILATGSSPIIPGPFDLPALRVMDSTGALGLVDVPGALLVVGGGYIGLELGSVYAALGSRVSVVEMTDGLLGGVDRDLVRPLQKKLGGLFENISLNTKVVAMEDKDDSIEATFQRDVEANVQRFDRVLISIGRHPNSACLGLENTKVEVNDHGFVVVDRQQRTADSSIFAIGDVAGQPMLAHKATHEGKVAAEVLAGKASRFEPKAIPAVVFTDPEIAWAGLTETEAKSQGRKVEVARFPWAASGRAQAVGCTEGMTKWLVDPDGDRVVGCGIVGAGAGELISEAVLAIEAGASMRDVAKSIHPHPTLSETLAGAGEVYYGVATDLYRPKRRG